ncbi:hypothetical protein CCAX7_36480 [Capsulimonas corticalis]|uniref:Uncharacterized protein n=1 Tax=Capsulimonas corticalis TaxID=2219043 RepID=A0A402D1H9_9BACT|nr:SDR family NAD(P)-dependent oxidoreductase [Capsulimonas corticalis]BDI31597.1 hypothetical protein CCAX7_36480 [Capsulimonas corticalis]
MTVTLKMQDPRTQYPHPPYPVDPQKAPGSETKMTLKPNHGEQTYRGSGRLAGRAALITGADSGIGKAVALAFAREGADVLISYLNEDEDAKDTERWVTEAGRNAVLVPGDIQDPDHCHKLVQRAIKEFGHLDILVNNAAHQAMRQDITGFTPEELEKTFRTNVFAMFYLCQEAELRAPIKSGILGNSPIWQKN